MAQSLSTLKTRKIAEHNRWIIFGPEGIGKTTFAAGAPNPVFIWLTDGVGRVQAPGWPEKGSIKTYSEVIECLAALYNEDHDRKSLIIDDLGALEAIIHKETCDRVTPPWKTIEDPGYGKGYAAAVPVWQEYNDCVEALYNTKQMNIIHIGHVKTTKFNPPDGEAYDTYQLQLNQHTIANSRITKEVDVTAFLNFKVATKTTGNPSQKNPTFKAVGKPKRIMHFEQSASFGAKNRAGFPEQIEIPSVEEAWNKSTELWDYVAQHRAP